MNKRMNSFKLQDNEIFVDDNRKNTLSRSASPSYERENSHSSVAKKLPDAAGGISHLSDATLNIIFESPIVSSSKLVNNKEPASLEAIGTKKVSDLLCEISLSINLLNDKLDKLNNTMSSIHTQIRQFDKQDIGNHQMKTTVL